ncbi:Ger(x)C family spore germination protein [Paenibacillus sp. CGMCC 1.16610]|uniref:Ger(X)C family spore germination protein n=1 Tax=Paenibacillus anseongense TaxID=2682845 RepID=A0ABW9U413_9BACL|nr:MULTISPECIES: Ger(x)C family spore germination protein [Paenibacillus]MBA2943546.1 Ger(x)C family spore germination protein [Paenibacillus sp. CGMCC 1.16610]MVQ33040.1 Ger(x)C family spore germination protein [Paenibacillus anseongense]
MRRKHPIWKLAIVCFLTMTVGSGCWDSKDIDNRLMIGVIGLEKAPETGLRVWFRFPLPRAGQETSKKDFFTMSQKGFTVPDAMNKLRYKLPKALETSSTRALLLDEPLAKTGLTPFLEFAIRERSVPLDAVVAVVRGNMERIFSSPNPTGELSGIYTKLFFEPYAGGIPRKNVTKLWEVYAKFYNPFHANLIPVLIEGEKNSFSFGGNAIFISGRMVGEINKDESLLYEIFTRRFHDSEVELMSRSDIRIVHNHTRIATSLEGGKPIIKIDCSLVTVLIDSSRQRKLNESEIIAELESDLNGHAKSLFEKTQREGADVFGFGNRFRSRLEPSQYDHWNEMFKSAEISYSFHIDMRNTGLEFIDSK